ncbi:hypothetical protein RvY_06252-2 [Ramazzottius varieornatus]|nr:hypothetical protein RvY_06252-2 [Ramazzottius varieornatus]
MDLGYAAQLLVHFGGGAIPTINIIGPLVQIFTFLLAMVYLDFDRRKGRLSSPLLFVFWLLLFISGIIILRSKVLRSLGYEARNRDDIFGLFTYELWFPIVLVQLILSCFADDYPERFENWTKNPSPESSASFLNKLCAFWVVDLLRQGWQRTLTTEDIWDLMHDERAESVEKKLAEKWSKQFAGQDFLEDVATTTGQSSAGQGPKRRPAARNDEEEDDEEQLIDGRRHRSRAQPSEEELATSRLRKVKKPSLAKAIYSVVWPKFWTSALLKFLYDMFTVLIIVLIGNIISFTAHPRMHSWKGYVYTVFLLMAVILQTLCFVNSNFTNIRLGMNIRAGLSAMLYRKVLNLSNTSRRHFAVGNVTTMLTADMQRITDFFYFQHYVWITPVSVVIMSTVLWTYIGVASIAGLGTIIVVNAFQLVLVGRSRAYEASAMKNKDIRVRTVNEIFNEIKILKMYAWEKQFEEGAVAMRHDELRSLNKAGIFFNVNLALSFITPPLAALATYATYLFIDRDNVLLPRTAFVTLLFLFSLRHSLYLLPMAASLTVQAKLATERMTAFLLARELQTSSVEHIAQSDTLTRTAVSIVNGNFSWHPRFSAAQSLTLKSISLTVGQGSLVAIVGAVGSGKSSLLAAMLGLMEKVSGHVTVKGSIAYVTQQAWIQNMTLRDNILFGKPFNEQRYLTALEACALKRDLEILTDGDQTEIGEKGINLSGGQKLRVTLARAVYADADVVMLDDPLAAVDAHVGRHIFENVIGPNGVLQGKTRLFVTNAINWLPQCEVVVYLEQGRISEMGSYEELVERGQRFNDYLRQCEVDVEAEMADSDISHKALSLDKELQALRRTVSQRPADGGFSQSFEAAAPTRATDGLQGREAARLIGLEKLPDSGIGWRVYRSLAKDMSYVMVATLLLTYILGSAFFLASNIWVAQWTSLNMTMDNGSIDQGYKAYQAGIYALFILLQLIFISMALWGVSYGFVKAGGTLHNGMLHRLMRAPMSYFDTTPLGRILNRFSKDIDTLDIALPGYMRYFLNAIFLSATFVLLIVIEMPLVTAFIIPLFVAVYFVKRFYQASAMQLKRLDAITRAPLVSSLQQSIAGSSIIVATGQTGRFITDNHRKVDNLTSVIHSSNGALQWLSFSNHVIADVLTVIVAFFSVFGRDNLAFSGQSAAVGLSLMASVAFTLLFPWAMQNLCDMEHALLSIQRLRDYADAPVEAPAIIADYRPPSKWPYFGNIAFTDYETRYRPGMDLVLQAITGTIHSGEKIGVVGRTGSGKSTLTLALLRIVEPAGGSIFIDGTDISKIGLRDLRSRITIIPQEAALFSGTLRMNVDPMDRATDEEIWSALDSSRLKLYFQSSPSGLNTRISEGGANLSVGQRQLICLARALLRRSKILILDEATAAIDFETDKYVQEVVRKEFADCTVITIAHRINTIMDSTRVLVMDAGRIREFDTPANLIEQPDSLFHKLAKDAGAI